MAPKPTLALSRCRLRPARSDDLDKLQTLLHNEQVRRYLCDDTKLPRDVVARMLRDNESIDDRGLGLWTIETPDIAFAGVAGLQPAAEMPSLEGEVEVVIALYPAHWGRGLAGEVVNALCGYAGGTLELERLVGGVDQPNERSRSLMNRCGFSETGTAPGPVHELVLYERRL